MIPIHLFATILLTSEIYHAISHFVVLFRVRLLPRKDLVRVRLYFLLDTLSVFLTVFFVIRRMYFIAIIQIIQHLFYFITWDKSELAKQIIDWSSLEWQIHDNEISPFEVFGTLFDWLVHVFLSIQLLPYINAGEFIIAISTSVIAVSLILWNSKYAWASPYDIPTWVMRRLKIDPTRLLPRKNEYGYSIPRLIRSEDKTEWILSSSETQEEETNVAEYEAITKIDRLHKRNNVPIATYQIRNQHISTHPGINTAAKRNDANDVNGDSSNEILEESVRREISNSET